MSQSDPTRIAKIDLTEFRRSWRVVLLAMLGLSVAANASLLYAFGSLVLPLQSAFGWSRGDLQAAISFLFGGAVIGAQLVGWFNIRWGMRRVTAVSLVALGVVFALIPLMGRSIWWFYLMCALLPIAGMGTMHITWTHLVNLWFDRNRGLALALMLSGTGLTAAVIPSAVTWAITRWNWQAAFVLLALLPVVVTLPLALRWMDKPERQRRAAAEAPTKQDSGMAFREALRSARFWTLNIALAMVVGAMVAMVTSTVPLLRDKGLSAAAASQMFGGFGIALIVGRIVVGYLVDRLWAPGVAAVTLTMPALGCLLLSTSGASQTGLLTLAVVLVGLGAGAEFDLAAYLMARYFGMRDYGRLFGVHVAMITIASALSPGVFGWVYSATGSYATMLAVCGTAFLIGPLMLLPLGGYPKFGEPALA